MEGAMAAIAGAPNKCSSLQFRRNTELMRRTGTSTIWRVHVCGFSFSDRSHLQYYRGIAYCANKNKSQKPKSKPPGSRGNSLWDKKKTTLLQGLCKDLSALSNSNGEPPVDGDAASLVDQVRGRILSDALEVVLRQLAQAKAERKERKRQLKAQKKALKARKDESPSSSSGSSQVFEPLLF